MRHSLRERARFFARGYLNLLAPYSRQVGAIVDEIRILRRQANALLALREQLDNPEATFALAVEHKISAYAARYVVRAQRLQTALVTEDR